MANIFKRKTKADKDFSTQMLPQNRKQVFRDVLNLNWQKFVSYGFLIFLFTLPIHAVAVWKNATIATISQNIDSGSAEQQLQIVQQILSVKNLCAFIMIPCFMLLSVGIAGLCKVIRQYAWGENVFFGSDFYSGVKSNAGQMLLLSFISGVIYALTTYAYNLSQMAQDVAFSILMLVVVFVTIFIGLPILAYSTVCIALYQYKFGTILRMSLSLTFSFPFKTYLALICCVAPFVVQFVPNQVCFVVGRVVATLLVPIIMLAWFLFAFDALDEKVNKKHFPELVGRGVFKENTQE